MEKKKSGKKAIIINLKNSHKVAYVLKTLLEENASKGWKVYWINKLTIGKLVLR